MENMEPKIEPTLENEKKENPSRGVLDSKLLASQEGNRETSREDIAGVCNESFLFQGHTISTFEECIKNARSAEDFHYVVDALEYLKRRTENEPYHELTGDDLVPLLESIAQKDISYFVREGAKVNLRVPLDSLSLQYKRSLLQREFGNIQQEGVATDLFGHAIVRSPADIDALDDATVLRAFRCYGEINPFEVDSVSKGGIVFQISQPAPREDSLEFARTEKAFLCHHFHLKRKNL